MNKLALYIGQDGLGEEKVVGSKAKYQKGRIGYHTMIKVEEDPKFSIKPYLKPIEAAMNGTVADILDKVYKLHRQGRDTDATRVLFFYSEVANQLRELGYDCDGMIESGLAICHPDYDAKDIL